METLSPLKQLQQQKQTKQQIQNKQLIPKKLEQSEDPNLQLLMQKLSALKARLLEHAGEVTDAMQGFYGRAPKFTIFISVCNLQERARVFTGTGNTIETGWQNAVIACRKFVKEKCWEPEWVKADIVNGIRSYSLDQFHELINRTRKNYMRQGIALDPYFKHAFLEQEVNANGFITRPNQKSDEQLNLSNINFYLKTYRSSRYPINNDHMRNLCLFTVKGYFYDRHCFELHSDEARHGRRKLDERSKQFMHGLIDKASAYLAEQTNANGKMNYGFFPSFHKPIPFYNMLRHASTAYSMIEAYEVTKSPYLQQAITRALNYLVTTGMEWFDNGEKAYIMERESDNEIKLGANAAALLALTKYSQVFKVDTYEKELTALANGILAMQNSETGAFIHVLNADLTIKEEFRIIYYDGEAAFGLMRLYGLDRNTRWLTAVEKAFEHFIANDYWKNHDHWLSYCTNELTQFKPEKKYFEFGLKNVAGKLSFIRNRDTAYPTFLELLMASWHLIDKIKKHQMDELLQQAVVDELYEVIEVRAEHQLNSFFFPEMAMYFKRPAEIEGSFYIRHHSFRNRIDDIEHNLSGYINYYSTFFI